MLFTTGLVWKEIVVATLQKYVCQWTAFNKHVEAIVLK
jgi:hypothetical protein